METKQITVQGVKVTISQPYAAGAVITEAEAKALNQVRAENIGNNKRKEITDLTGTDEEIAAAAQALISAYDAEYVFNLASVGGGRAPTDPVEKEARRIAREFIAGKLKENGITQKAYLAANGEDAIKLKIAELAEDPEVIKAAKAAIKEREKRSGGIGEGFTL